MSKQKSPQLKIKTFNLRNKSGGKKKTKKNTKKKFLDYFVQEEQLLTIKQSCWFTNAL